jgi:D-cysteine desulfhydrase
LIGLARMGVIAPQEYVLFLHTDGLPTLHVYDDVLLGRSTVAT